MKQPFLAISFLFCFLFSDAQNLVPNYSFENYTNCPNDQGQIYNCPPWFTPDISNGMTPDYYHQCSNVTGVPTGSAAGFQYARTGKAFAGIFLYQPAPPIGTGTADAREYIECELVSPLVGGKRYCVNFYVNLLNNLRYAVDAIGAYLSTNSVLTNDIFVLQLEPQVYNPVYNFMTDTLGWILISGEYISMGGEKYITIGNFKVDSMTHVDTIMTMGGYFSYYNIDDVSVYEMPELPEALAGKNKEVCKGSNTIIGQPAVAGYQYYWQPVPGFTGSTTAQVSVKPMVTTTYYLTVTDTSSQAYTCQPQKNYEVTITVKNCDTVVTKPNSVFIPNIFSPNGDGNNDVLYVLGNNIARVNLVIYNRWGERVFESTDIKKGWDGSYMGKNKESIAAVFIYYCKVIYADGTEEELKGNITVVK
jgi:gliding motility-associated-like protein